MQQHPNHENGIASSPAATGATGTATLTKSHVNGGRFDFDDGGTFCGGWEEGKAHGHGVCTGPKGQGAYSGSWHYGFEVSGVYTWPSGSTFEGQWQNGKRHGLGVETRGRWIYRGEWTQGFKGRYGVRQSNTSMAKYEGTWANGLQDGYGSETYADEGTYQGQWLRGMRHGYGVRTSAPFGKASKFRASKAIRASLTSLRSNEGPGGGSDADKRERRVDDTRGGFVLKMNSSEPTVRRKSVGSSNIKKSLFLGIKLKKQRSTGDLEKRGAPSGSIRSTGSSASWVSTDSAQSAMTNASIPSDSNASFVVEDEQMDPSVKETYMGEWKNDKRTGFGVSERSDGLKYEGEWYANKKYGYGVTTFSNGEKEEGKYKNNVLITNPKKKHLFLMRSAKFRERIDAAVGAAQRASKIALQKADIAISRTATARGKAEQADIAAAHAREDSEVAMTVAKKYAPDFKQPGLEKLRAKERFRDKFVDTSPYNQKDFLLASSVPNQNQIPNQIPNQYPNQIGPTPNPIPTQLTNQILPQSPHNQMPNQQLQTNPNQLMHNQIPNQLMKTGMSSPPPPPLTVSHNQSVQYQMNPGVANVYKPPPPMMNNPTVTPHLNPSNQMTEPQVPTSNPVKNEELNNDPARVVRNSLPTSDQNQMNVRRASRRISTDRPYLGNIQQSSIDHFDHYKRPPSRDCSVDRYSRATERLSASRQASIDRGPGTMETPDRNVRAPSAVRMISTPTKNGSILTGNAAAVKMNNPGHNAPFEDIVIRNRSLGQDIIPSPNQPKRTESLYMGPNATGNVAKNLVPQTTLSRKKSMPDFQELPRATGSMSREEVSALGSARREEIRRQADEKERLRANPLLYLVSPQVKDWFSRQQLVIIVLFVNISLAIIFYRMLT